MSEPAASLRLYLQDFRLIQRPRRQVGRLPRRSQADTVKYSVSSHFAAFCGRFA
jgi:hypothetical protein